MTEQNFNAAYAMQEIGGGVTAAKGFVAAGIHAGIKNNPAKRDLALLASEVPAR